MTALYTDCDGQPLAVGDTVVFVGGAGVFVPEGTRGTVVSLGEASVRWPIRVRFEQRTPMCQSCHATHVRKLVTTPTHADELTKLLLGG